ncbi:MAG TPA: glycoside hydrolase family 2 TIM barrel-domain containing protein [Terracidiphilus sp.]
MQSRRQFLHAISAGGCLAAAERLTAKTLANSDEPLTPYTISLRDGWEFRMDPSAAQQPSDLLPQMSGWSSIQVPHTWQSLGRSPEYSGVAWYRLRFQALAEWSSRHVRIEFEAVNHTAHVFLNGKPIGEHVGKGYTAFTFDLPQLKPADENTLLVRVDNRPQDRMLPRNKSYDWPDDGGIIRPVNLLITPRVFIERVEIDAVPDPTGVSAEIRIRALVRNTSQQRQATTLHAGIRQDGSAGEELRLGPLSASLEPDGCKLVDLGPVALRNPALWHFDTPHLYQARVELKSASEIQEFAEHFGIRKFEVRGSAFYLNGEKVSLIGVERMAGSHPEMGFAETTEWIDSNHRDMKELNCVFTRVHWPQDRRVLDFCDRHGILMQQEVPAWGPETFWKTSNEVQHALEQNGLDQLREMIQRDRNHPCIVVWGLCNEVDGKNPRTRQFARTISAEARRLDASRLQTYASHTLATDPASDMAGEFDFVSTNEYYGSWTPGGPADVESHLDRIRKAFPGKPIVVSEYGWCECQPAIMPGDENRVFIVNSHTEVFRKFPEVAGAIYFDYDDYRTLVGDKGAGALRQRVHGVVDLYGRRKPSFEALRLQASPVERAILRESAEGGYEFEIGTRQQLPGYTLRGYSLRWLVYGYDDLPMEGGKTELPDLHPGSSQTYKIKPSIPAVRRMVVDLLRPTGFSIITVECLDKAGRH